MPTKKKPPSQAALRQKQEVSVYRRRSAALSLLQVLGRWEPFLGPTGVTLWRVPSERGVATYTVYVEPRADGLSSCSCPDWEARKLPCKHVTSVRTLQRVIKTYDARHRAAIDAMLKKP